MAKRREPTRIAQPYTGDLGDALTAMVRAAGAARGRPTGIRRTRSNNPAKVGVNRGLQVRPNRLPTAGELESAAADLPTPGDPGARARGLPPVPVGQQTLFDVAQDEQLALFDTELNPLVPTTDPAELQRRRDRTQVLSPPNSLNPDRPRAREARYDPDRQMLTVRFRNGGTYAYYNVPGATWRALRRNKSFGKTMDRLVINQYPYEKVSF